MADLEGRQMSARAYARPMIAAFASAPRLSDRSGGIDALRGVLALWVLLTHVIPWSTYVQGEQAVPPAVFAVYAFLQKIFFPSDELHPAVLGFIVLSGYCIHRNGFRADSFDIKGYAIRRALRILPVFLAASLFGVVVFAIAASKSMPLTVALSGTAAIAAECVVAKVTTLAALVASFHPCAYAGNAPLATVMVEITLYAAYAVMFLMVWRGRGVLVWWLCAAVWVGGLAIIHFKPAAPLLYNWWQNSSLIGFLPYWWIGVLLLDPRAPAWARRCWPLALAAWLVLTIILVGYAAGAVLAELRKLLFALLIGFSILWIDRVASSGRNPLSMLGRAGYSIYAFHAPLIYLLAIYGVPWGLNLAAAVALGGLMYVTLERPLARMGRSPTMSH